MGPHMEDPGENCLEDNIAAHCFEVDCNAAGLFLSEGVSQSQPPLTFRWLSRSSHVVKMHAHRTLLAATIKCHNKKSGYKTHSVIRDI